MIELGPNRYGKSGIRLVKVVRGPERHELRDLTVAVALEGEFEAAHTEGDNSAVVATDTMKNTVYAFAHEQLTSSIEAFGLVLARHFTAFEQVEWATVTIREHRWQRLDGATGPSPDAFIRSGEFTRTAEVSLRRADVFTSIEAGIDDLTVMKTSGSSFSGFPRDRYTTLPETDDRILATKVAAVWSYPEPNDVDFDAAFDGVRRTLLQTFADHDSPSVQNSIWIMGRAILERHPEVGDVRMTLPNLHHWLVDVAPFGLPNERDIFTPTSEPYGLIEALVRRGE